MNNGESPAFVIPKDRGLDRNEKNGLTKREYFAAMAMQGICAAPVNSSHVGKELLCKAAVEIADELLKALES